MKQAGEASGPHKLPTIRKTIWCKGHETSRQADSKPSSTGGSWKLGYDLGFVCSVIPNPSKDKGAHRVQLDLERADILGMRHFTP